MLETKFKNLCQRYNQDNKLIQKLWLEIAKSYSDKERHYHTLEHLNHIYNELDNLMIEEDNYKAIEFAIFYHDIVYNVQKNNNEEASALIANKRLSQLNVPQIIIEYTYQLILLTKFHTNSNSQISKFFLDADLSILGSEPLLYKKYVENIRKEYKCYSDEIYNQGRQKILKHFINQIKLFQTEEFYNKYERQAQENILNEYHQLQKKSI